MPYIIHAVAHYYGCDSPSTYNVIDPSTNKDKTFASKKQAGEYIAYLRENASPAMHAMGKPIYTIVKVEPKPRIIDDYDRSFGPQAKHFRATNYMGR